MQRSDSGACHFLLYQLASWGAHCRLLMQQQQPTGDSLPVNKIRVFQTMSAEVTISPAPTTRQMSIKGGALTMRLVRLRAQP